MRKRYTLKPTKAQMKTLCEYWVKMQEIENEFYQKVRVLEENMQKDTNIKDVEFISCDGEYVGIGNGSRTMKLIQRDELDK